MENMTLYKYRAFNDWSMEILRTGSMWYSHPSSLNDSFEFSVPIFVKLGPVELVEHYRKRFHVTWIATHLLDKMMEHGGGREIPVDPSFVQGFLGAGDDNRVLWCIAAVHFLAEQGMSDDEIATRLTLKEDDVLREKLEAELRDAYQKNMEIGDYAGVLSLSLNFDSPLLWAHYGDSCRGVCIGLQIDLDGLAASDQIPIVVEYREDLPRLEPMRFFSRSVENVGEMLKLFYGTKHSAWSYEKELRLFAKEGNKSYPVLGKIAEVIAGEKISNEAFGAIVEAVAGMEGVSLFKIMRNTSDWGYRRYRISL